MRLIKNYLLHKITQIYYRRRYNLYHSKKYKKKKVNPNLHSVINNKQLESHQISTKELNNTTVKKFAKKHFGDQWKVTHFFKIMFPFTLTFFQAK